MKHFYLRTFLASLVGALLIIPLSGCEDNSSNIKREKVTAVVTEKEYKDSSTRYVGVPGKGGHIQHTPAKYYVKVEYKDCYHWFNDKKLYNNYSIGDEVIVNCQIEILDDGRILFEIIN